MVSRPVLFLSIKQAWVFLNPSLIPTTNNMYFSTRLFFVYERMGFRPVLFLTIDKARVFLDPPFFRHPILRTFRPVLFQIQKNGFLSLLVANPLSSDITSPVRLLHICFLYEGYYRRCFLLPIHSRLFERRLYRLPNGSG